jgi:hypothetical protein
MFNQLSAMGFLIGTIAGIALFLWYMSRKEQHKGKQLGELIGDLIAEYNVSIFMVLIFIFIFASAAMAASVTDERSNPLARFLAHGGMGFFALVSTFALVPNTVEFFRWKGRPVGITVAYFFVVLILLFGATFPVLFNAYSIAHALGQTTQLSLFFDKINPFLSDAQYYYNIQKSGILERGQIPLTYNAFQELNNIMFVELGVVVCHIVALPYEAIKQYIRGAEGRHADASKEPLKKKEKGDADKATKEDKPKEKKGFDRFLAPIVEFIGVDPEHPTLKTAKVELNKKTNQKDIVSFLKELEDIYNKVMEADGASQDRIAELKAEVDTELRALFGRSPKKENGLGLELPKGNLKGKK